MERTIHWAIIGLGKIARKFTADLQTVPNCKLYAVASRTQEKANAFAKEFNAEMAYGNYQDVANDPKVDAVYIATPHVFHKENSMLCLQNGKAVLCEKPLAMNAQEVEEMIASAKANNTLLMEALWTAFLPHFQHFQKLLKDKIFGDVLKVEADFGFVPPYDPSSRVIDKQLGGGSLLDIGIYPIFSVLSTLGMPETIEAKATFFESGADESCKMIFSYKSKEKAFLKSTFSKETPTEAVFYCENGTIKINGRFHEPSTVALISKNGKEDTLDFGYSTIGYNFEALHFNQLIRNSKTESNVMTFDFSRKLIKLLDDVRGKIGLQY